MEEEDSFTFPDVNDGMVTAINTLIESLKSTNQDELKAWDDKKLSEIILEKLNCDHLQKKVVKTFENFLEKKLFRPHFHSKNGDKNIKEALPIFYRHGISKIISNIMEDALNKENIQAHFIECMMQEIMNMEDDAFYRLLSSDSIDFLFLIKWMDEKDMKVLHPFFKNNENNVTWMNLMLTNLYTEREFGDLVNNCKEIHEEDKQSWKRYYDNVDIERRVRQEEEDAANRTRNFGANTIATLFNLMPKMPFEDNYKIISAQNTFEDFL